MLVRKSTPYDYESPQPPSERIIFHVDMDAFFASVEQSANPFYRGKPVLVGGHSLTRGVVCAASYEARPYGIHAGMSLKQAKQLCPHSIIVPVNSAKYSQTSKAIFKKLEQYTPQVEVFSIDEAFMDITQTLKFFYKTPEQLAHYLKQWVHNEFGITMSVGIAPNKLMAKLLSDVCKPDGLKRIYSHQIAQFLECLPVETLCGIGSRLKEHLNKIGIYTCGQLGKFSEDRLLREFGVIGSVLKNMGRGVDHSPVRVVGSEDEAKSVGHSYTLMEDCYEFREFKKYLLWLSERVARRLRRDDYQGNTVHLRIRFSDKRSFGRQHQCHYSMDEGPDIYHEALTLFNQINKNNQAIKRGIRLIGVTVGDLCHAEQGWLLAEIKKSSKLTKALDEINNKFGEFTAKWAMLDFGKDRKANSSSMNLFGSGR